MEGKGETVNGPMLREKRRRFEDEFGVPEEKRLTGDGWIAPFCRAYKIKEYRRHGEAGSVDTDAVAIERARVQKILATFPPKDRFNFDETSLFALAPPDRGLATKQMSGKKKEKFRITLGLAANADGSEKLPLIYIGKSKKPRCFGNKTPQSCGFYYRNNKKAWMTAELFEEWIKMLDLKMGAAKRFICLYVDNFSGHSIAYNPRHIQLEFFEPNLTSFVQPLDAGVIRCFKALYRRAFCRRAIDLDEAGERNIYKINLREAMLMAKEAWDAVDSTTIQHCWNHCGIQADSSPNIRAPSSHPTHADPQQLWASVKALKVRNRIIGTPMTIDEILAPREEAEIGATMHNFEGGDKAIVAEVRHQLAVECGEVIEIDSDSDDEDDEPVPIPSRSELILICEKLEMACITYSDAGTSLELSRQLRQFRGALRCEELQNAKQVTLQSLWQKR
ncbi:hypothetical protein PAXINDRAFT_122841 [Paxillus involutus ATCC 200175]|uniref:DDE-1 domain-containing protein n=1 Tax=Paxillus involutus ATCC 200175 TaxID=664439 RepID=A0A0C9SS94_PAXIN|nr:hypothetical protein PAXINDRAFT_122841 [Paxillus involutus ATCC 200175]